MNDDELLGGLRGLALAEPELGFDPDEVADRAAKRLRSRRRVGASGAAALVVVGAVVATLVYGNSGSSMPISPAVRTTAPAVPTAKADAPDLGTQIARGRAHLLEVLSRLLPEARDVTIATAMQLDGTDSILFEVHFADSAGPASVSVNIYGPVVLRRTVFSDGCLKCGTPSIRPDGSRLFVGGLNGDGSDDSQRRSALHYRLDGVVVAIDNDRGVSYALAQKYNSDSVRRARHPLTDEQLLALVTDPAFSVR
ncbi:hypothetical protein [Kibdelosporangium phytohabitans]|uniref:Uncharacterized protein n=1 Tax=Kibdelosporangium phytohabitans TaxID=860235 RepID=A0A0N9HKM4_9PSEU|nr:hypothetical protein [Kibdelosporangium phytohabitans]ALG06588.1 hypothetical protein AOZ06_06305 [Kibdelosporangium phytohabitans]MBE1467783.1 hypothetical protein [Kibdelosporangium phytohabitans]